MSIYFSKFPLVQYNQRTVRDITRRTDFVRKNLSNPYVFLPYTVREGEKPEDIAQYYYGSIDYTWIVLLANGITDPYYEWPLSESQLNTYIIAKYSERSNCSGFLVLDWAQNLTITANIVYYAKPGDTEDQIIKINPVTYDLLSADEKLNWTPVRVYDYEVQINDNKREIRVIDVSYLQQIVREFEALMKR
jgi:hypothetical protein